MIWSITKFEFFLLKMIGSDIVAMDTTTGFKSGHYVDGINRPVTCWKEYKTCAVYT